MSDRTPHISGSEQSGGLPAPGATPVNDRSGLADQRVPRVAVIGVHGVAHHEPCATANAMVDLLLSLPAENHDDARYYESFRAVGIQVPLQRMAVPLLVEPRTGFAKFFSLQEISAEIAHVGARYARMTSDAGKNATRGIAGFAYMRRLLQGYEGGADGDVYVTTRLEGKRAARQDEDASEVHIYEVLWADLARPTNSLLSFFLSLFQLLLHLGSLSRLAIDTGAAENPELHWKIFRHVQRYAVRMLQLPIPLLKVILLIALFSCLPALAGSTHNRMWFPLVMGGIAGLVIAFLINRGSSAKLHTSATLWALRAVVPIAAGAGAVLVGRHWMSLDALSAIECWLVLGLALLFYVLDKYNNVRTGAKFIGWLLFGLCFLTFCTYLIFPQTIVNLKGKHETIQGSVLHATLWTTQWMVAALRLSWMILFGFVFLALLLGSIAWRLIPEKTQRGRRARARAAVRTTRFALALPSLMFLLVTTILWAGMFSIARGIHDPIFEESVLTPAPGGGAWLVRHNLVPDPAVTASNTNQICNPSYNPSCLKTNLARIKELDETAYAEPFPGKDSGGRLLQVVAVPDTKWKNARPDYLEDILVWSAGSGFAATLALFALSLLLLIWWALPSVFAEQYRLRDEKNAPRFTTDAVAERSGSWLSRGLDATSISMALFWCAIFLIPPLFLPGVGHWIRSGLAFLGFARASHLPSVSAYGREVTRWIVKSFALGTIAAVLAVAVKYGSPVLGAILDVDNYLRTSPDNATPRAKIVERYVSLLRYVAAYRGADGRGYDSVVIVAHSLGSLISADLLRFLKHHGDPGLTAFGLNGTAGEQDIDIKMLTMGNPTRQLLNRFFPYLYDWIRDEPDNGLFPLPPAAEQAPQIAVNAFPNPGELGLKTWVNVYRSGDYVGRSLWLDEWYRRTDGAGGNGAFPQPIYTAAAGSRKEACIGAGAHTRYWDDTAPDVARLLDELIKG